MNQRERLIAAYKVCFLEKLALAGVSPSQFGRMVKQAEALSGVAKAVIGIGGAALGLSKWLIPLVGGGVGFVGGSLAEKMFGPNESDVANVKMQQQIDALRRASLRQEAQNQLQQEGSTSVSGTRKRPRLQVSTAV